MDLATLLGAPPAVFVGLTLILIGGAAVLTGRAIGGNWKPAWQVVAAGIGLAIIDRFLIFALFEGTLLSLWGFVLHYALFVALGLVAWRIARVSKFVRQYPWRYQRTSLLSYEETARG
ncbi:DUF6867 family protein [Benzoatithermus flavus]|uniref:DUF6867 family protein n=1 Tax=Benzoatithermus flavus TaxID=3108223 RepID=A0ABU8XRP8_9PROT